MRKVYVKKEVLFIVELRPDEVSKKIREFLLDYSAY